MSDAHIRANEVQKTIEPVRQPGRELIRRQEQGPAQAVAPQAAYRRVQLNRNGLRPADLLALQRAVGNRSVQRMVAQRQQLRGIIGGAVQLQGGLEDEEPLQGKLATAQRQMAEEEEEPLQGRFETAQRQGVEDEELQMKAAPTAPVQLEAKSPPPPNRTGLPDGLKTGIESLSGMAIDHVRVHTNSAQPAQLNALAYTQGSDIHVAPGQEQHLPHEAWHVVQQAQGRVQPTMQMQDGVPVNDDEGLEREADVMGAEAMRAEAIVTAVRIPDGSGKEVLQSKSAPEQQGAQLISAAQQQPQDTRAAALPGAPVQRAAGPGREPIQCIPHGPDEDDETLQLKSDPGATGSDLVQRMPADAPPAAPVQMVTYYHGGGQAYITNAIAGRQAVRATQGELGSRGTYYWRDDENAALVSAIIYNALQPWAVMAVDVNPAVSQAASGNMSMLVFATADTAPLERQPGQQPTRVYGMHYRFLQANLDTLLGQAPPDPSIEGVLIGAHQGMTGRAFLDSYDFVVSPTSAENYRYAALKQARGNDPGLTNLIYGVGANQETNDFSQVWHGQIDTQQRQTAIEHMGLSQKDAVPATILAWQVATRD